MITKTTLTYQGWTKKEIAQNAIFVEQERIKENVGNQDQYLSALGGFNHLTFNPDGTVEVEEIDGYKLAPYLMLFDTGTSRIASEIAVEQIKETPNKTQELSEMQSFVDVAIDLLRDNKLEDIGRLLHESWKLKRSLTNKISTPSLDEIYEVALDAGALGGKILGAGGGGYMLIFADPDKHNAIENALYRLRLIPFSFEYSGTQIILDDKTF